MKKHREAHSAGMKFGMGDSYGTGFRAKIGRMRDSYTPNINPVAPKALKKPPKTLA